MAAETIIDFLQEARQSLEEVAYAIREGKMSNTLQCDSSCVHLNLTTLEGLRFCVRLSLRGFEVVGREYDSLELDGGGYLEVYETVYALLNHLSPSYPSSFQHALADKLENLDQRQNPRSTVDNGSLEPADRDC